MSAPLNSTEPLRSFLNGLSSKIESQRTQAARDLSHYASHVSLLFLTQPSHYFVQVATAVADMPSDVAKAYDEVIKKRLHELVHSNISEDESGGLAAIGASPALILNGPS
jgi:serine/threonine-protein kinase mTOR